MITLNGCCFGGPSVNSLGLSLGDIKGIAEAGNYTSHDQNSISAIYQHIIKQKRWAHLKHYIDDIKQANQKRGWFKKLFFYRWHDLRKRACAMVTLFENENNLGDYDLGSAIQALSFGKINDLASLKSKLNYVGG